MGEELAAVQTLVNKAIEFFVNYSFQVIGALIILVAGILIGKWVSRVILKLCKKKNLDITLSNFLASIGKMFVVVFAIIIALGKFGITITPLIAAIGAAAFGATYAIQGPLSNYGAGLSIIFGRPFVVGDTVNVAGVDGVVDEVKLACTTLINEDGIKITIPNKHIVGEILHNSKEYRIVENSIGIGYSENPEDAIDVIRVVLKKYSDIAQKT